MTKLRCENDVIGSVGNCVTGMPSSSTSGGNCGIFVADCAESADIAGDEGRRFSMGGGIASSSSVSMSSSVEEIAGGECVMTSDKPSRECTRQYLKKLSIHQFHIIGKHNLVNSLPVLAFTFVVDHALDILRLQELQNKRHVVCINE